jgi:hypothetical protein
MNRLLKKVRLEFATPQAQLIITKLLILLPTPL